MKRIATLIVAVALVGFCASDAKAQSVSISSATSETSGTILVTGSFSLGTYTLSSVTLFAQPTGEGGGEGGEAPAPTLLDVCDPTQGSFTDAPVNVPTGATYDVQALLTVTDGTNTFYYYSTIVTGVGAS